MRVLKQMRTFLRCCICLAFEMDMILMELNFFGKVKGLEELKDFLRPMDQDFVYGGRGCWLRIYCLVGGG